MDYFNQSQDARQQLEGAFETQKPSMSKKTKMVLIIVISAILALVLLVAGLIFGIASLFTNHESYRVATEYIKTNQEIIAIIGDIEGFGFMPSGSISTSPGRGDADFSIRVIGAYGEGRAFVELQRRADGDWEIVRFNFVQVQ